LLDGEREAAIYTRKISILEIRSEQFEKEVADLKLTNAQLEEENHEHLSRISQLEILLESAIQQQVKAEQIIQDLETQLEEKGFQIHDLSHRGL
jgi:predicted RNase H-like nuclease (RuvC/YqgF family)